MSFTDAIRTCLSKYVTFSGRAARSEFWWFWLFVFAGSLAVSMIDVALFGSTVVSAGTFERSTDFAPFSAVFALALFLPSISVSVRRLHDTDRSGWWWWLALIPVIGFIVLIVWYASRGTEGPNRFGPDPLPAAAAQ